MQAVATEIPGAGSFVGGLAAYGPIGIMLGICMLAGLYAFKRMFDRILTGSDHTQNVALQKLDVIITEMQALRREVAIYGAASLGGGRANTPLPESIGSIPRRRRGPGNESGGGMGGE